MIVVTIAGTLLRRRALVGNNPYYRIDSLNNRFPYLYILHLKKEEELRMPG
jgi:hypothetical protein